MTSFNEGSVRDVAGRPTDRSIIRISDLRGKSRVIPGNMLWTSGSGTFTLPATTGPTVSMLIVGGGGGGGGGSGRTSFAGYFTGGGGGGSGGLFLLRDYAAGPGNIISYSVGYGGTGGAPRDGIYSSGSSGGAGNNSSIAFSPGVSFGADPGQGGINSPTGTGGLGGLANYFSSSDGLPAGEFTTIGGSGAPGWLINTTVGITRDSILSIGAYGSGGPEGSGVQAVSGTGYGAGGTGGGCVQSDVYNYRNMFSTAGTSGAVFIFWGY
jgi:hypothetical protein